MTNRIAVELLDLDDAGAEVGEQRGAERCREECPELDHGDAGERWLRGRVRGRLLGRGGIHISAVRTRPEDDVVVLTERRGGVGQDRRRRRHLHDRARLQHRSDRGVVDHDRPAVMHHRRVVEQFAAVAEDLGPHVGFGVELDEPLVVGLRPHGQERALPERDAKVGVVRAGRVLPRRMGEQLVEARDAGEGLPEPIGGLRELHEPAIGRLGDHQPEEQRGVGDQAVLLRGPVRR